MKRTTWAGFVATSLLAVTTVAGCSDDPTPPPTTTAGTNAGGTSSGGAPTTGGGGSKPATMLSGNAAFTILSPANAPPSTTPAPTAYTTTAACIACHGSNGEGVDSLAPEIRHTPATYSTWIARNGRMGTSMSAFPVANLSDADLMSIVTWLDGMPKPTTPEGLYKDFCGNCHGPTQATGGAVAVNITTLKMADVATAVRTGYGTDPALRTGYMPKFDVALLTDAELAQIQTFLGSIP